MNATSEGLFGQFLEPVFRALPRETAEDIARLTADSRFQTRIEYLASQANEGVLTEEEHAEYEALIDAGDMLAALQAIARRTLRERAI
jgi:hypothetical protein